MDTSELITIPQAARILGITRQRMHQIVAEQSLSVVEINSRLRLISRDLVRNLRDSRKFANSELDSPFSA